MRKLALVTSPFLLFLGSHLWADKTINCIKDGSFELNNNTWIESTDNTLHAVDQHDTTEFYDGEASGLTDVSKNTGSVDWQHTSLDQSFNPKKFEDLDSLVWAFKTELGDDGRQSFAYFYLISTRMYHLVYCRGPEDGIFPTDTPDKKYIVLGTATPGKWIVEKRNFKDDWVSKGLRLDEEIGHVRLRSSGHLWLGDWTGSKDNWDAIYLGGLCYYDGSVESINIASSNGIYTPNTMIKEYGKLGNKYLDVFCKIFKDSTEVYTDSKQIIGMNQDEEKLLAFKSWTPQESGTYLMKVYLSNYDLDEDDTNDSLRRSFDVTAGFEEKVNQPLSHFNVYPTVLGHGSKLHVTGTRGFNVYNAAGVFIKSYKANVNGTEYAFADLTPGVYFIKPIVNGLPPQKVVKVE
jgi:hypothetical protein